MSVNLYIGKWRGSLAVRIPKVIAGQWGISEGSAIKMNARNNQVVMCKQTCSLSEMLAQVTPENRHPDRTPVMHREGTMVVKQYVPDAGDIVWLAFSPQAGREQAGRHLQ